MGRWAQRRLAGGGPRPDPEGETLLLAAAGDPTIGGVTLYWTTNVDFADFSLADFVTSVSSLNPTAIGPDTPNSIALDFAADVSNEGYISYIGSVSYIRDNQVIKIP